MPKRKFARIAALATTAVATVALLSGVVATTGAYFTDVHGGSITGTFGAVKVNVSGSGASTDGLAFNFAGMMPGEYKTANISVQNVGTENEDIYLVFSDANGAWSAVNTLGTYGEFVVNGTDYYNLNNHYPQWTSGAYTNACGDTVPAIAYLPHVNGLGTLAPGASATFTVQFRYSACISNPLYQGQNIFLPANDPLGFSIVAEQPGILPNDAHNGTGRIPDLSLPSGSYQ
jgi:hypothetical protein